jgi:septal ring factor EnvC (AmiA/AmiB activator)
MVNTALTPTILSLEQGPLGEPSMPRFKLITTHLRTALRLLFVGVVTGHVLYPLPAFSQSAVQTKEVNELELERVRDTIEKTKQRQQALRDEIAALDKDMEAINRALIATANRGQELEGKVSETEGRLEELSQTQSGLRKALSGKRALLAEVIAALQRMGTKPPPAILVRPEDAISSIRSSILLGAVLPEIRDESSILLAELQKLAETTRKIEGEKRALASALNDLAEDETRLSLLIDEKKQLFAKSNKDLEAEAKRAIELGQEATSMEELIRKLETEIASAAAAASAAQKADERRRQEEQARLAEARDKLNQGQIASNDPNSTALNPKSSNNARIEPAIAFSSAKGALPLPVQGIQLYAYGSKNSVGSTNQNLAYATRPNARVRAPADSWVVYAGPFRSYGQLIILNGGEGYHVVLSGLSEINVEPGRFVLAGEPIGRMGATRIAAAVPLEVGSNRPVLYVEFRKDGKVLDPSPWWAVRTSEGPSDDS